MVKIEEGKELIMENVLSLRKKMSQKDIEIEMVKIGKWLEEKSVQKNGSIVTATYAIEQINDQLIMDMEILVPLNQKVELVGEYKLKSIIHLRNAIYVRYKGNPAFIDSTYNHLTKYMEQKNLQPITTAYNVNIVDIVAGQSYEDMIVDVYIGVNPSVL